MWASSHTAASLCPGTTTRNTTWNDPEKLGAHLSAGAGPLACPLSSSQQVCNGRPTPLKPHRAHDLLWPMQCQQREQVSLPSGSSKSSKSFATLPSPHPGGHGHVRDGAAIGPSWSADKESSLQTTPERQHRGHTSVGPRPLSATVTAAWPGHLGWSTQQVTRGHRVGMLTAALSVTAKTTRNPNIH